MRNKNYFEHSQKSMLHTKIEKYFYSFEVFKITKTPLKMPNIFKGVN